MDAGKERKGKIGLCLFFFLTWERYKCQGKKEKKKKKTPVVNVKKSRLVLTM